LSQDNEQSIDKTGQIVPTEVPDGSAHDQIIDIDDLSKVYRASHTGDLKIFDIIIPCAVLEDGTRLLTQRGVFVSLGRHKNPAKGQASIDDRPAFLAAKNLEPFITDELREKWAPVPFQSRGGYGGNIAFGYRAEILPMVCNVFIDADEAGATTSRQKPTVERCRLLVRGLAVVGIVALVDAATGYERIRDREALEIILRRYISAELLPWQKTFPNEFYEELFRLRGWQYRPLSVKRPVLVGKLTQDLVYKRLAPGVLDALLALTPRREDGKLEHHLHRHLTPEEGRVALERHLHTVTAMMRGSATWDGFKRMLNRALPRQDAIPQLPLYFKDEDENY
jgi:P63C domain